MTGGFSQHPLSPAAFNPGSPFLTDPALAAAPVLTGPLHAASPLLTVPSFANSFGTGSSLLSHSVTALLKQENYPNVKFWYRRDWVNYIKDGGNSTDVGMGSVHGKTLMSKGINKNAKYIEDADGEPVDGFKLRDIRSHARAIWAIFQTINHAPSIWERAAAEVAHVYHHEMCTKFPEFAFCEN